MKLIEKRMIFGLPAPTPECHASTVAALPDGSLLAAWFGGTREGADDVGIWYSRNQNGAWSAPERLASTADTPHWNPVLFCTDADTVTLFYKVGSPICDWKTMVSTTKDGGKTWSTPAELIAGDDSGGRGPVKNKPLRLSDGLLAAPGSTERGAWRCFVDLFDGKTWSKRAIPVAADAHQVNVIQPTLWQSAPNRLHALMRSDQGRIYRSDSDDLGRTWSEIYPTQMPNNNSGLDCAVTADGTLVLVCNPVPENWGARSPLSVFTSTDNGATFQKQLDLETQDGEFSYPAVIACGNTLWVTYTYRRRQIACCRLEL